MLLLGIISITITTIATITTSSITRTILSLGRHLRGARADVAAAGRRPLGARERNYAMLCYTILIRLYYAILYYAILYYTKSDYTIVNQTILYYTILHHTEGALGGPRAAQGPGRGLHDII